MSGNEDKQGQELARQYRRACPNLAPWVALKRRAVGTWEDVVVYTFCEWTQLP